MKRSEQIRKEIEANTPYWSEVMLEHADAVAQLEEELAIAINAVTDEDWWRVFVREKLQLLKVSEALRDEILSCGKDGYIANTTRTWTDFADMLSPYD